MKTQKDPSRPNHNPARSHRLQLGQLRFDLIISGALFAIAPALLGAKGCEVAQIGSNDATCGGLLGQSCNSGEFCNFPADAICGAADATGTCETTPEVCTELYAPVCGCDDKTYGNECKANAAGVSVAKTGACDSVNPPGDICGGLTGAACEPGQFCNFPVDAICGAADATGECSPIPEACDDIYSPVCGCDDKTYSNDCEANAAGVSVASKGECSSSNPSDPPPSSGKTCGGLLPSSCAKGEFCNYPPDAICGAADATGTCEAVPDICTQIYAPVCGCDDKTYSSECTANAAGVSVASKGECGSSNPSDPPPSSGKTCGGLLPNSCAKGEFCNYPPDAICGAADATGTCETSPEVCTEEYDPVCGCDDTTYSNACFANAAGVSVATQGECSSGPSDPPPPSGKICGGLLPNSCADGEFCNYPPDAICGAADATGTCEAVPAACDTVYVPVCGCDDTTYGNDCEANAAGVSVASKGECGSSNPSEPPPSGKTCGGLLPSSCADGEFCNYPPDAICGAADATGTCEAVPEICTQIYAPVCGCDDQTYGNDCEANAAGVSVASKGECGSSNPSDPPPSSGKTCGGLLPSSCADGEFCNYPPDAICGAADATGTCEVVPDACIEIYAPVCGCDDVTYSNSCFANAAGVSVASDGECGNPTSN